MSNLLGNIEIAKEQFRKDLMSDKDFIEYRKNSHKYGTINICINYFYLYNNLSCADLIKRYLKKYNLKL